jgi:tRNA (uracil-5-)-methyltransferase TRM9
MNIKAIKQLNKLNLDFYQTVAQEFSDSRNYYWHAWDDLLLIIKSLGINHQPLKVLDIGCGNGRFAKFLSEKLEKNCEYIGIDNSSKLLNIAKENSKNYKNPNNTYKFIKQDIITGLLKNKKITNQQFDLIIIFGVMHHIPSFDLRKKLFKQLESNLISNNSYLISSFWQFTKSPRFQKKNHDPSSVNINPNNLEKNDYIIDWLRGKKAFRYFHFTDKNEVKKLVENTDLKISKQFFADGGVGKLNLYTVLQKKLIK